MSLKPLILATITLFLFACGQNNKNDIPHIEPQCLASQSQCVVNTAIGDIEVLFDKTKVLTEVPFTITLNNKGKVKLVSAKGYLEGKDMFMGQVPVFFQQAKSVFEAETLLGSCSEEQMIWLLWLTLEYQDSVTSEVKSLTFNIEFTSYRY